MPWLSSFLGTPSFLPTASTLPEGFFWTLVHSAHTLDRLEVLGSYHTLQMGHSKECSTLFPELPQRLGIQGPTMITCLITFTDFLFLPVFPEIVSQATCTPILLSEFTSRRNPNFLVQHMNKRTQARQQSGTMSDIQSQNMQATQEVRAWTPSREGRKARQVVNKV